MLAELARSSGRREVSLEEVLAAAPALTRVDRKYLVPLALARTLIADLHDQWGVLCIRDRHSTRYRSTYFDTARLDTARAHVQGRRRRWKARSRLYVEDGLCRVEVKAKDGRGQTVKTVAPTQVDRYGLLTDTERTFLGSTLAGHATPADLHQLHPSVEVSYERMTLARVGTDPARMTVDWGVDCRLGPERVWVDEAYVVVETKAGLRPTYADRLLLDHGVRPRSFSKYVAAASLLRSDIPDNDVRRLRGSLLHHGRHQEGRQSA